jgi:hypothetical protein
VGSVNPHGRERDGLLDADLAALAQLEQREKGHCLLDSAQPGDLALEVQEAPPPQHRAEPLDELRHRWEAQRHVVQRHRGRVGGERPQRGRERLRVLRRQLRLRARRERRRPQPEEPVALRGKPLREPLRRDLHAPVLGEPPRQLLGRLLGLEVGQLGGLVREEPARLQLEQRGDEDEELAAGVEVELLARGEPLDEGDDDAGDVHVRKVELVAEDERQQQVERALERVEVEIELAHLHGAQEASVSPGRGFSGRPSAAQRAGRGAGPQATPRRGAG